MEKVITNCIIFLMGTFTGGFARYCVTKFTDKRRIKEKDRDLKEKFKEIIIDIPKLIDEMHDDLIDIKGKLIREFVLVPSRGNTFNGEDVFIYYKEEHDKLSPQIKLLEQKGFVTDITFNNTPRYRMTEEFVKLILNSL